MSRLIIAGGKVFEETSGGLVVAGGKVVEDTTSAAAATTNVWRIVNGVWVDLAANEWNESDWRIVNGVWTEGETESTVVNTTIAIPTGPVW